MTKNIICVSCPMGCGMTVELSDKGEFLSVTGNTCKRGAAYAETECVNPVRSLTTTIKAEGGTSPVVPCKSSAPVPKAKIIDCAKAISAVTVKAPIKIGDVLIKDILGTGVDIVATNHCPAK